MSARQVKTYLPPRDPQGGTVARGSNGELRVYRTAISTTAEYGNFHGGTIPSIMSAIVTAVNRVNEVYEQEISIRLELVANNDTLINFGSTTADPFSNNSGFALLGQNQTYIDARIGTPNYDFGHIFSTGGGGIASLGSVLQLQLKSQGSHRAPKPNRRSFLYRLCRARNGPSA